MTHFRFQILDNTLFQYCVISHKAYVEVALYIKLYDNYHTDVQPKSWNQMSFLVN